MPPNPVDNPDLYDVIVLGGKRSPGVVTLSGHDSKVSWDIKKGPGLAGASMTRKAEDPAEFTATFYIVKDDTLDVDEFAEWDAFQDHINSTVSGKTPKAYDVYHPDLARQNIKQVVKASIGGMTHDGKGGATVVVKFTEYKRPKPAAGSPRPKKKAEADPDAALKAELAALTEQFKKTKAG